MSSRPPSVQAETGGSARDQIVDARQPDAERGTQSGVPADETVDGPADGTRAAVREDQDTAASADIGGRGGFRLSA